jgi:hypothetical protein
LRNGRRRSTAERHLNAALLPQVAHEVSDLIGPDPTAHSGVPAHRVAQAPVPMEQYAVNGLGAALQNHLGELEPEQDAPWRQEARGEDLMLVVPAASVRLDDLTPGCQPKKGCPPMGRDVEHLDLIGIIRQQLTKSAPVVAIGLLFEAHDPCSHRQDTVVAHQPNGLAIGCSRRTLADQLQRSLIGIFQSEQKASPARFFVKVQNVGIANNVVGSGRSDQDHVDVLRYDGFEQGSPDFL